jgi:GWxTD domain-containing protein
MIKNKCWKTAFGLLILIGPLLASGAQKNTLPERYRKWLDEEVVYIITPVERDVFLKLQNDRERDLFEEAFWKQRDPTMGTPENEFRTEHYRRINHANHYFGRSAPAPGWKTDRGRVYIILGEPNDIQSLEGKSQIYPTEIWFYQGLTDLGLPSGFNMVFYKKGGTGDYETYSPLNDGPMALLTAFSGDPVDYLAAYEKLREVDPAVAQVSMSLIPGEQGMGRPSLSSDLLIQRVESMPERRMEARYARKFLEYKDIVEVEYSVNYINSDAVVKVSRHPSGIRFVHYALEPERLSVNQFEDKYYTNLKLNGTVTAPDGTLIYQYERDISLELNPDQAKAITNQPVSIRDVFPIIPGRFRVSILMKNEISKEFTSVEEELYIPGENEGIFMTSPFLGYDVKDRAEEDLRVRPFQLGRSQIYAQSGRVFVKDDDLAVAFQLNGLTRNVLEEGEIIYRISRDEEEFRTFTRKVADYASPEEIIERIPLKDFSPAHYFLEVALLMNGQDVVTAREEFDVTFAEALPRPWFYNKLLPETNNPAYLYTLGSQYYNQGSIAKAKALLERAYQAVPLSEEVSFALAGVYQKTEDYLSIETLLKPLFDEETEPGYDVHVLLSEAYQKLGKWARSTEILSLAIQRFGVNPLLLNAIGESYLNSGDLEKASEAWEQSLNMNPGQGEIKNKLSRLKEKK